MYESQFMTHPYLGVANDSDNLAVLLHLVKVLFYASLSAFILPAARCLCESLLLRAVPLCQCEMMAVDERERNA